MKVRVVVNGLPFRFEAPEGMDANAAGAALAEKIKANPDILTRRQEQLGLTTADVENLKSTGRGEQPKAFEAEETSTFQEIMIGMGRGIKSSARGIDQLGRRIDETVGRAIGADEFADRAAATREASQRLETNERELFERLDNEGIGAEDLGQIAPDLIAFLGAGGLPSLAARGAILGGVKATAEDETLKDRGVNAAFSGVLSAAGPGAAKAFLFPFKAGAKFAGGLFGAAKGLGSGEGGLLGGLGRTVADAARSETSGNPALQQLGRAGFESASKLIQQMNSRGKDGVAASAANAALTKSIRQVGGQNVVDFAGFNQQLAAIGKSQLNKELGRTFGQRMELLRSTFDDLARVTELDPATAQAVLTNIMGSAEARSLATALTKASTPEAKQSIAQALLNGARNISAAQGASLAPEAQTNLAQ